MVTLSGGAALEKRLAEIAKKASESAFVEVGFLEGSTYPDGTSVPMVAAIQEFGSSKSPPRPFFRGMISDKSPEWPDAIADLLVANDYSATKTLTQTGAAIKGQLQEAISVYVGPGLAQSTIDRKGHEKELIETGTLLNSVDFAVK